MARSVVAVVVWAWAAGCGGDAGGEDTDRVDGPADADTDSDTDADSDTDTDADSDTDADTDSDTDADSDPTGDTGPADPCAPDPSLTFGAAATPGPMPNQLLLTVDTSLDATVAALCVNDADPSDAHLLEGTTAARRHELKFMGLLPDTAYTCKVAPTCPTAGAPAAVVPYTTTAPPIQFPVLDVEIDPVLGMTGHYAMAPWQQNAAARTYIVVWGPDGRARWWYPTDQGVGIDIEALLDPGTTTVVWGGGDHANGAPTIVDLWDGELFKAQLPTWGDDFYTHDTKRIADGRLLSLQYVPNSLDRQRWLGFGVRITDPATGLVDWEFDSQLYVDRGILPPGNGGDIWHANWVDWIDDGSGPVLYVSLYEARRILAIDATTLDLRWDLGADQDPPWTVVDGSGNRLSQRDLPMGQHGLEVQGDEILVYDNGVGRLESRAERWRIDAATKTATRLWMWTEPGWYEPILGDIDDLGNGRVLVTEATLGCCFHPTDYVEVDVATGGVASRWSMPRDVMTGYRSQRYDGCDLFANTSLCAPLATRAAELEPLLR